LEYPSRAHAREHAGRRRQLKTYGNLAARRLGADIEAELARAA
jgi:hypothetical protein